jgi:hypothetical protein
MKRSSLLLLPLAALLMLFSCKRESSSLTNVTPGGYATLDEIFAKTALPVTTQSIAVASGGSIWGKGGAIIYFPRDAFQFYNGALVTGSVDIKFYDWLKKGDMVFSKVLPVSNNEPLFTSGQFYVEATQNGVPVRLRRGANYKALLIVPQYGLEASAGDQLYIGQKVAGSINTVNWYGTDTAGLVGIYKPDTVGMFTDSLNYFAASHPIPNAGYNNFSVKVNLPPGIELEQSLAVALMDGLKTVYPVSSAVKNVISAQHIPAGPIHLAVMGVNKGNFYAGYKAIFTPGTDSTYEVDVKAVPAQDFRLQLNALQ